jgi:hypothetical protein
MPPDETVDDALEVTHPAGQQEFLDGASKVLLSVAEIAFGASTAASTSSSADATQVKADVFLEDVVHPSVQSVIKAAAASPSRLTFNELKVKEAMIVDHFCVFNYAGTSSRVDL